MIGLEGCCFCVVVEGETEATVVELDFRDEPEVCCREPEEPPDTALEVEPDLVEEEPEAEFPPRGEPGLWAETPTMRIVARSRAMYMVGGGGNFK
jgi:hypothetical protein